MSSRESWTFVNSFWEERNPIKVYNPTYYFSEK